MERNQISGKRARDPVVTSSDVVHKHQLSYERPGSQIDLRSRATQPRIHAAHRRWFLLSNEAARAEVRQTHAESVRGG